MTNEIAIRNIDDAGRVAKALAESGFYKDAKTHAQAMVKVMAGVELNISPIAAMTGLHIVEGKVTMGSGLVGAQIQRSGIYRYRILEMTEKTCRLLFQEKEDGKWVDLNPISEFSLEDAKRAELTGKLNWKRYLKAMLFSRALTQGARMHTPSVFAGPVYTPEELGDNDPAKTIDVAHVEVTPEPNPKKEDKAPSTKTEDTKTPPTAPSEPKTVELPTGATMKEIQKLSESLAISDEERKKLRERAGTWNKKVAEDNLESLKKKVDERQKNGVCLGQIEFAKKILVPELFTNDEISTNTVKVSEAKSFKEANEILTKVYQEVKTREKKKADSIKKPDPAAEVKSAPELIQEAEVIETISTETAKIIEEATIQDDGDDCPFLD